MIGIARNVPGRWIVAAVAILSIGAAAAVPAAARPNCDRYDRYDRHDRHSRAIRALEIRLEREHARRRYFRRVMERRRRERRLNTVLWEPGRYRGRYIDSYRGGRDGYRW